LVAEGNTCRKGVSAVVKWKKGQKSSSAQKQTENTKSKENIHAHLAG
jgi:hypothetical protein